MSEELLATQISEWQWEYDHNIRKASVFSTSRSGIYRLEIVERHIKSGIGAGEQREVKFREEVKMQDIDPIVKSFSHDRNRASFPFSRNKWQSPTGETGPLKQILSKVSFKEMKSFQQLIGN